MSESCHYVTFGQRYAREEHPDLPNAHPDGWLEVWAESYDLARLLTFALLGSRWSNIHDEQDWEPEWYPAGRLATVRWADQEIAAGRVDAEAVTA